MAVKKSFLPLVSLLEENLDSTVSDLMDQIRLLVETKTGKGSGKAGPTTYVKDEDGDVVAVRCYYHKLWMSPAVAEFGPKANSPSGLSSMCKDGVAKWSAQQREAKKAGEQLLEDVSNGIINIEDIAQARAEIEEARTAIIPRDDNYGFETYEELADTLS